MEMSTPRRPDLRRSVLNGTLRGSPAPFRRSLPGPSNTPTPLAALDEEKERSDRRSRVAMRRSLTNITPSTDGSPLLDAIPLMGENQIEDHLRICAKLYTENKISSKNAWKLHVIDVMRKIASTDDENVLQVAGTSLDIGAKVYGFRVDDVHAKSLQLASSMNKGSQTQADPNEDGGLNPDASLNEPQRRRNIRKKTKKIAPDKRNTIDSEEKTLFATIKHTESAVFATRENIDICATDNLFTQKLPTNPGTRQLMLMSSEPYWTLLPDAALECEQTILDIEIPEPTHNNLCLPFKNFEIGTWDVEDEERSLAEQPSQPGLHEPVLDDQGLPIAELDGSIQDIFEDHNSAPEDGVSDTEEHQQQEFQVQIHGEIAHVVDAVPEESRVATDYGYNTLVKTSTGKYIDKLWAGPSHWKVKFIRRSTARYSGATVQQIKYTKKVKTPQKIVWSQSVEDVCETLEAFVHKRARPTVAFEKITLPAPSTELSFEWFNNVMGHLLIKSATLNPRILKQKDQKPGACEVPGYNYENLNDSMYCSQHNGIDINDNDPIQDSFEEDVPPAAQQQFLEDNLVNAPETVSSTHIPYAMQAKKMDMKKLKSAVWQCISVGNSGNTIKPTNFSDMYQKLPKLISADMKKELTCHLTVVALLHLCNENNLNLTQTPGSKDFTIVKAECKSF